MQYIAKLNINGMIREIKSKNLNEWIAKKQIQFLVQELARAGKQVSLISFTPKEPNN